MVTMIRGSQILDETIDSVDIKNHSILVEDLSQEVIDLINTGGDYYSLYYNLGMGVYLEVVYFGNKVLQEVYWNNNLKERKIRECIYEYDGNKINRYCLKQYDSDGNLSEEIDYTLYYDRFKLVNILGEKIV